MGVHHLLHNAMVANVHGQALASRLVAGHCQWSRRVVCHTQQMINLCTLEILAHAQVWVQSFWINASQKVFAEDRWKNFWLNDEDIAQLA